MIYGVSGGPQQPVCIVAGILSFIIHIIYRAVNLMVGITLVEVKFGDITIHKRGKVLVLNKLNF